MPDTIRNVITPHDKTLRSIFRSTQAYLIDIYQREYKWTSEQVLTLLNDIGVRFGQFERRETDAKLIQKDVRKNFEPYFLNTFLTHSTPAYTAIVDGQQRLTTFLLMFIKFHQMVRQIESSDAGPITFASSALEDFIFETNDFGEPTRFKIHNKNREEAFRALLEQELFQPKDETQEKIVENYNVIDDHFERFFKGAGPEEVYDVYKLTYYISYVLDRLSIIEVKIEQARDVAMIFEVVNDRGLGLRPYEILKGKLIGNLDEDRKESANEVWTKLQNSYFDSVINYSTDRKIDLDNFFKTFFRAKFANSQAEYEKFEGQYHYEIYRNEDIRDFFGKFDDANLLYERVVNEIAYFANLYLRIRTSYKSEYLIFNKLLDQNQQYLLILSAVTLNDPKEEEKIDAIARKFDQFHVTLRLLDVYKSNAFQSFIYELNRRIRGQEISEVIACFDEVLIHYLVEEGLVQPGKYSKIEEVYEFERFRDMHNRWVNFSKYVLMRVDRTLADLIDKPSYVRSPLEELEERFNKNKRQWYALHLEHIYANNEANRALFTNEDGVFDEQRFNQVRNRLGAVILLTDKQNLSSGNDIYRKKWNTYKKSNLIWNEVLVDHLDNDHRKKLLRYFKLEPYEPNERGLFPLEAVDARQRELFSVIKHIWGDTDRS